MDEIQIDGPDDFLIELQAAFGVRVETEVAPMWRRKLAIYSPKEMTQIFDWVTDHCDRMPKMSKIREAANELGILAARAIRRQGSPYSLDDSGNGCTRCRGMGLLNVWFDVMGMEGNAAPALQFVKLTAANQQCGVKGHPTAQEPLVEASWIRKLYRCECSAGDRQPPSIPLWRSEESQQVVDAQRRENWDHEKEDVE
jgi:hypothetical protein